MLKESTLLKGNLCIYKCFIDVLYIFDRVFKKKKLGNAPDLRQMFLVLIYAMCSADFTCGNESTIQSSIRELLLTVNNFQATVCLFVVFCLFIYSISWKHDRRHLRVRSIWKSGFRFWNPVFGFVVEREIQQRIPTLRSCWNFCFWIFTFTVPLGKPKKGLENCP